MKPQSFIYIIVFFLTGWCQAQDLLNVDEEAISLGPAVNSPYAERVPLISLDGKALYFARKAHPQNMGTSDKDDIWVSYLNPKTKEWTKAVNVGAPLNNDEHNFVVSINTSGDGMYLANDYQKNSKDVISYTSKNGRKWETPRSLHIPDYKNNSPYVSYHVSKDEKYLLIAAEQEDTQGGRDLYISFKSKKGWSAPLNLGPDINTSSEENSIFLAADNKTVYFSSAGHQGFGGYDLFMSKRLDDSWTRWSAPINLGEKINTPLNDLSVSIPASGDYAYLARGPIDNTDLYKIKLPAALKPSPVTFIQAQLVDAETMKPVDGRIYFESLDENRAEEKGIFKGKEANYIVPSDEDLGMYAQVKGYFPVSDYYANQVDAYESEDSDNDAYAGNAELQALQNKLDDLQRELKKLSEKKTYLKKSKQNIKSRSIGTRKNSAKNTARTFKNVGEEDELDKLQSKYQKHYDGIEEPAQKTIVSQKDSDSDALKKAREKYNTYYGNKEVKSVEKEEPSSDSEEKFDFYVASILSGLFGEYYLPIVKEIKKKEEVNLSAKDITRLEIMLKENLTQEWGNRIAEILSRKYNSKLEKETKQRIKQDLKEDFAESLRTDISLLIKQQKEKSIKQNIQNQLANQPKKLPANPKRVIQIKKKEAYQQVAKQLQLVPLKKGAILTLNNIFFDINAATLKAQSHLELNRIYHFLDSNSNLSIEIGGHTNGWCSPEFASELSNDRAETVYQFLIDKGIDNNRISYKGYGKSDPVASNDTVVGRKKNQRVELKIIDIIE